MTITIFPDPPAREQPAPVPSPQPTTNIHPKNILVLNAGSSTLKFRLFKLTGPTDADSHLLARGLVEKWGTPDAHLKLHVEGASDEDRPVAAETTAHAAQHAI